MSKISKNPFKFVNSRPNPEDLFSKLEKSYTNNIDVFSPTDIHILLFFYISLEEDWATVKFTLNSDQSILKVLKHTKATLNYGSVTHELLIKHRAHIPEITVFNESLLLLALTNLTNEKLLKALEIYELSNEQKTQVTLITQILYVVQDYPKYVKIDSNDPFYFEVESKYDVIEHLSNYILSGIRLIPRFKFINKNPIMTNLCSEISLETGKFSSETKGV